jgi:hypothetical protein
MAAVKQVPKAFVRSVARAPTQPKAAGDISSVFPSLSGKPSEPLPPRFQTLKQQLVRGKENALEKSWLRLLDSIRAEIKQIKASGSNASVCTLEILEVDAYD